MATGFGFNRDAVVSAARQLTDIRSDLEFVGQRAPRPTPTGSSDVDLALQEFTTSAIQHQRGLTAAVAGVADRLNRVVAGHAQVDDSLGRQLPTHQPSKGKNHE
ncbi:hypothetical protein ACGFIE_31630 [Micromonospora sp. NPDC049275]|uniref:hypothetical protein n=1 Tax=Micromonospora sp. NPDC049275 TaxID=3364268 RepID=UPI003712A4AC